MFEGVAADGKVLRALELDNDLLVVLVVAVVVVIHGGHNVCCCVILSCYREASELSAVFSAEFKVCALYDGAAHIGLADLYGLRLVRYCYPFIAVTAVRAVGNFKSSGLCILRDCEDLRLSREVTGRCFELLDGICALREHREDDRRAC